MLARLLRVLMMSSMVVIAPAQAEAISPGEEMAREVASPLLAIDRHRATVVDRIVVQWAEPLSRSSARLTAEALREMLLSMRADQLMAASLAGTLDGLRDVLANALLPGADAKPASLRGKALGDPGQDVVYVPVTPCRLVETRGTYAAVYQGGGAFASSEIRTYAVQGGNGVCLPQLPPTIDPSAVQLQVYGIPNSAGSGDIEILPQGGTFGSTATLVYLGNNAFTSASTTAPVNLGNRQIGVQVRGAGAHVAIDVVGYFRAPDGGFVSSIGAGAGLTGGGSGSPVLSVDTAVIQSRVTGTCVVGASIRAIAADGSVTCETDDAGVTSVTADAGGGLVTTPAGGITGSGSIAVAAGGITNDKIAPGTITSDRLVTGQRFPACILGQFPRWGSAGWTCGSLPPSVTTVESAGDVGRYTSIAIGADGLPVMSYYDITNTNLKVAKCIDVACASSATISTVDATTGAMGTHTSLAIGADGFPVVSYFDQTNQRLKVAKCANAGCTGLGTSTLTTVDSTGSTGTYSSIAVGTDGFPVVSYHDLSNLDLKVAKCTNAACTGSATITTLDSTGTVGTYTSIAIGADGIPVISYYDVTNADLKVAKCANAACAGSATVTTIDSVGNVGWYTSIAIGSDAIPVVSYYDLSNGDLKVAKCINAACTGSATITTVDSAGTVGGVTSIAIGVEGNPVISYFDSANSALKIAKCANAACTGSAAISTLDSVGLVGTETSIAIGVDGFPVVSYSDDTNFDLKVLKCSNAACLLP